MTDNFVVHGLSEELTGVQPARILISLVEVKFYSMLKNISSSAVLRAMLFHLIPSYIVSL
jgi:hypothetical protein